MSRTRLIGLLLALGTCLVFGRVVFNDFTRWDDAETISENPNFTPPTASKVLRYWTEKPAASQYYNPVTYTVWGGLAYIAGDQTPAGFVLRPTAYHAASVIVHALSVVVVFTILLLLFDRNTLAAAIGAMLFALHPVQVETVAWASGMKDLLCGLFSLAAIWQYLRFSQLLINEASARKAAACHYAAGTLCLILALLSKPGAIVVPFVALVVDRLLTSRPLRRGLLPLLPLLPWALLAAAYALYARHFLTALDIPDLNLWQRVLVAGDALTFYLIKLVLPLHLVPDYGRRPQLVLASGWAYVGWLIPLVWAALLISSRQRRLIAAGAIFLIALLPVLGLVAFDFQVYSTVADHYLYLPMLGVAIAAAWLIDRYHNQFVLGAAALILALLGARTIVQIGYWRNAGILWDHVLAVNPNSFAAYISRGNLLALMGREDQAAGQFAEAIRVNPESRLAHDNLGQYFLNHHRPAEAASQFKEVLRLMPQPQPDQTLLARLRLGVALVASEQYDEGIAQLSIVLEARPNDRQATRALRFALDERSAATAPPATQAQTQPALRPPP